jgi:ubiquinone/menaquinone biosynthesis C-methylase UbiE
MRLAFIRTGAADDYGDEFQSAMASEYEQATSWTRMRLENVRLLVDPRPGDRVLDIGTAAGGIAHFLSTLGCEPVGVDLSAAGIARARERYPELRFAVADARSLPFEDGSFDKAVAADVTEHFDDETLRAALVECRRVLVPGGTLSIHTPNPKHAIELLKARNFVLEQNPTHIGLRTGPELRCELERAGFTVELDVRRAGFYPGLRTLERVVGSRVELLGYRICMRGRVTR